MTNVIDIKPLLLERFITRAMEQSQNYYCCPACMHANKWMVIVNGNKELHELRCTNDGCGFVVDVSGK